MSEEEKYFESMTSIEDFKYGRGIGGITIKKYIGNDEEVTIPSKIDGSSVKYISSGVFDGCESIKHVLIPGSVKKIGDKAFEKHPKAVIHCPPNSYPYQYARDHFIKRVDSTIEYVSDDEIKRRLFKIKSAPLPTYKLKKLADGLAIMKYNENAEVLEIPREIDGLPVIMIESRAFQQNKSLKKIIVPNTVREIAHGAFCWCENLEELIIPDSVEKLGKYMCMGCLSLKEIKLPPKTNTIFWSSFQSCMKLKTIVIPDGVKKIGGSAFKYCESLTDAFIPDSVTRMDADIFRGCQNVTVHCSEHSQAAKYAKKYKLKTSL